MRPILFALMFSLLPIAAHAADLPQSRLGAVFAEPVKVRRGAVVVVVEAPAPGIVLSLPGYYGRPNSFQYSNYYGTSPFEIYSRLPYACGLIGYC
jgi:hypothetical protein